ncbi:hypothetical protein Vadar_025611 [Vaccinium darrowii]|uniref:Uncharacterized protein n=1 Tax=Vaccinium darrowii TaxID=229202 RepID=A0ACB7XKC3_9ERIC|nr:hypothetical protein Vadar_025611 [Vaccinium darrowii]
MLELDAMGEKLGYAPPVAFYFKKPRCTLDNGLVPLISDNDAYGMTQGLDKDRIAVVFVEHRGGVKLIESQVDIDEVDIEVDNDQVDTEVDNDEVDIEVDNDQVDNDEVDYSDSLSDSVYYSDHSYQEGDDDHLYETFVDDESEFVGFPNTNETQLEGEEYDDQGMLSDEDIKYDSDYSLGSTSDEETEGKRRLLLRLSNLRQRPVKLVKNDKRRIRARCEKPCQWEVYTVKVLGDSSYQVRTYSAKHSCIKTYTNKNVTSHTIARRYMEDLRTNPWMPIQSFKDRVMKEMKVDVSRTQLYRAKRKATQLLYGSNVEQYGRLWDYCEELKRSNPGSTMAMDAPIDDETGQPRFSRLIQCSVGDVVNMATIKRTCTDTAPTTMEIEDAHDGDVEGGGSGMGGRTVVQPKGGRTGVLTRGERSGV